MNLELATCVSCCPSYLGETKPSKLKTELSFPRTAAAQVSFLLHPGMDSTARMSPMFFPANFMLLVQRFELCGSLGPDTCLDLGSHCKWKPRHNCNISLSIVTRFFLQIYLKSKTLNL